MDCIEVRTLKEFDTVLVDGRLRYFRGVKEEKVSDQNKITGVCVSTGAKNSNKVVELSDVHCQAAYASFPGKKDKNKKRKMRTWPTSTHKHTTSLREVPGIELQLLNNLKALGIETLGKLRSTNFDDLCKLDRTSLLLLVTLTLDAGISLGFKGAETFLEKVKGYWPFDKSGHKEWFVKNLRAPAFEAKKARFEGKNLQDPDVQLMKALKRSLNHPPYEADVEPIVANGVKDDSKPTKEEPEAHADDKRHKETKTTKTTEETRRKSSDEVEVISEDGSTEIKDPSSCTRVNGFKLIMVERHLRLVALIHSRGCELPAAIRENWGDGSIRTWPKNLGIVRRLGYDNDKIRCWLLAAAEAAAPEEEW